MTPEVFLQAINGIQGEIANLRTEITTVKADLGREIGEVKSLQRQTNGKVRALELAHAKFSGFVWAAKSLPVVLMGLSSIAAIVAVVVSLTSH